MYLLLSGKTRYVPEGAHVRVHQIWMGDRADDAKAASIPRSSSPPTRYTFCSVTEYIGSCVEISTGEAIGTDDNP